MTTPQEPTKGDMEIPEYARGFGDGYAFGWAQAVEATSHNEEVAYRDGYTEGRRDEMNHD